MKKAINKVRALELVAFNTVRDCPGTVYALVYYDVKKLRRLKHDELTEILFEKTLKLYPFAIVDKNINRFNAMGVAAVPVWLPLSPNVRLSETPNSEKGE